MKERQDTSSQEYIEDEELYIERKIRRREADWSFINSLPPRLKYAIILFIEKGDLRLAQKLSGLSLEEFIELLEKARVPVFITILRE